MKKITICIFSILVLCFHLQAQDSPAEQLAHRIAGKMKDSLKLTAQQTDAIYSANVQLHKLKMTVRGTYTNPDSLRIHLQRSENIRDSLYRVVLPYSKFLLYKKNKARLINNN